MEAHSIVGIAGMWVPGEGPMTDTEMKEYLDTRWNDLFRLVEQKERALALQVLHLRDYLDTNLLTSQRALDKAEQAVALKLEGMNELRAQIESERGRYATRDMMEEKLQHLFNRMEVAEKTFMGRLDPLEKMKSNMEGRLWMLGTLLSLLILLFQFITRWLVK